MLLSSRPPAAMTLGIAALALVAALTGCAATGADTPPVATDSGAPSDEPTPGTEPVDEVSEPPADPAALLRENLSTAVSTGNTDALESAFTDPVRVIIASSEADSQLAALDAVLALDYISPGVGTWEWDLPAATIDGYRTSEYYGDFFPVDVIVGRSSEGPVVAFSPEGERIHTILMAIDDDLLFF